METIGEIKKEKLLPSPYDSTLAMGAEINLADQRYRSVGGPLQTGYVERDNLFVFTYGRSAEEELDSALLKSRARLGLLGIPIFANSNGIVLYNGIIGRPIRTYMDFNLDSTNRFDAKDRIIRLKHEKYPEFRYSVEPFNITNIMHPDVPMTFEVTTAIDELLTTGRLSIDNLAVISDALKAVSRQYEPEKNWNYRELWITHKENIKNEIECYFIGDTEEMKKARFQILTSELKWMSDMEIFTGLIKNN